MKRLLFLILLLPCLVYGQTVGIKVASPIIKNSPSDNTVTGYADLLNGGYHITPTKSGRDSLNTSYSKTLKTGMLCYVTGVDSTYRWNGSTWIVQGSGNVTLSQLTDSLSNYTPLQDGLISGGNATIGTGSVTIDTAYYRINKVNHMSLPRTFTGISNSASGTQYYILVYGKTDNTLDTLQGVQDTIATIPNKPNGTVSINTVLVGDGGVESSAPDLTGYVTTTTNQTISGDKYFTNNVFNGKNRGFWMFGDNSYQTGISSTRSVSSDPSTDGEVLYLQTNNIPRVRVFKNGNTWIGPYYTSSVDDGNLLQVRGDINITGTYRVNGTPIVTGGTVTSITPAFGFTSTTPITTSGTLTIDSTQLRTVVNSYSLASGQPRLVSGTNLKTINSASLLGSGDIATEVPLTFGYGLTRSTNTITADTTSGTGLVSKTRLTGALGSKQGLDATLTALASYNTNGILTQTGADTFTGRTLTGTTNQVIITNGSGVSGNPTFSLPQDINTTATPQFARLGLGSPASSSTNLLLPAGTTAISSFRMVNGVAPTTPISGDWWNLTTGLRTQTYDGTQTKDVIFDKVNNVFAGYGVGAIVTDNSGNLSVAPSADRTLSNKLSKTANYTVTLSDFGANGELVLEVDATAGAVTITLPSLANMTGVKLMVWKTDSSGNAVTISGAVNINGSSTASLATQWASLSITGGTSVYLSK